MSFWEHVEELRAMIIRIIYIVIISFVVTTYYVDQITEFLLSPLRQSLALSHSGTIVYHSVFEKAWVQVDVSIMWAIIFSSPFWFYQIWNFLKPGLYKHEKQAVLPFLILGWFLFIAGMASGYFVMPYVFNFLAKIGVTGVEANINLRDYVSNISQILLFLGVIFQLPNVLLILGFMGIVTKQSLTKFRRYIYVGLALAAAVFSPPDVISMMSVWIPLCLLYELGVLAVTVIVHPYLKYIHMKKGVNLNE